MMIESLALPLVPAAEHAEVLRRLRAGFDGANGAVRSLMLTEMITHEAAAALRAVVDPALASYAMPDRGAYDVADISPTAIEPLRRLATHLAGRDLFVHSARALRFGHGHYQLTLDDHVDQQNASVLNTLHLEMTLDFSAAPTGEGDLVYTDRTSAPALTVPQLPLSIVLVERPVDEKSLYRFSRYLPFRVGAQRIHRLRVVMR